ncbi:MAG TPA: O-antigen ligase family protein [Pyrinomonadaceae bacterium]
MKLNRPTSDEENRSSSARAEESASSAVARAGERLALAGFMLYAAFAPHSIAGAEIALAPVGIGLLLRFIVTRRIGLRRSPLDLPIWLFVAWTVLSSLLSTEPRISIPKLQSVAVVFLFYIAQSIITRRTAVLLVTLMIISGVAGVAWSMIDLARGRGVLIEELSPNSPFQELQLGAGAAIWRVGGVRISSVEEIDEAIRHTATGEHLPVSLIVKGEHVERPGFVVTDELKSRPSPSGIKSSGPTHRFRASGWTRHYETFSETLQILAQLSLGFALAHLKRRGSRRIIALAFAATALLTIGIVLTAMRTVLVSFAIGAIIIALRSSRGRARIIVAAAISLVLIIGALSVWRTRPTGALMFEDDSSALRWQVARTGMSRIMLHPLFGHGMDAMQKHWTEWGFPGTDMIHLHSTPLQIAFDRGLPALFLWLWIMIAGWMMAARNEKVFRDFTDANRHGILLGATGAIAGFFASSLVNYNFGDAEVILVFWWLMGIVVALSPREKG